MTTASSILTALATGRGSWDRGASDGSDTWAAAGAAHALATTASAAITGGTGNLKVPRFYDGRVAAAYRDQVCSDLM